MRWAARLLMGGGGWVGGWRSVRIQAPGKGGGGRGRRGSVQGLSHGEVLDLPHFESTLETGRSHAVLLFMRVHRVGIPTPGAGTSVAFSGKIAKASVPTVSREVMRRIAAHAGGIRLRTSGARTPHRQAKERAHPPPPSSLPAHRGNNNSRRTCYWQHIIMCASKTTSTKASSEPRVALFTSVGW